MMSRQIKAKETKQPGGKKKGKGKKKKREESSPENLLQTLLEIGNQEIHALYAMRIIGQQIVHTELSLKTSSRTQKPRQY